MNDLTARIETATQAAAANATDVDRAPRFPRESVDALGETGLLGVTLPEDVGGLGGGPAEFAAVARALGASCASSAMVYMMHVCGAQVTAAAPPSGSNGLLREMAEGRHLSTLAFSERGSRSHFWAPVSQIAGSNADARLVADKSFVTSAGEADGFVVSTQPTGADSPLSSSLYYVNKDAGGIDIGTPWDGLGLRGNASAPISFDTHVSDDTLVGSSGKGLDLMLGVVLPWFQLGQAAISLGLAEGAQAAAVGHVTKARLEHLDQSLADLPTIRARLGRSQIEIDTVSGFISDLARRLSEGDETAPVLSAKAAGNEMALRVTNEAMLVCGGAAMSKAMPIERYFRDARAGSVMAPTTDVLFELTGRAAVGMPLLG